MTTAIILAGGMGTRLQSVVPDLPKPMAPIHGRPFLEHQMNYWIDQGVSRFIISVGYMKEVIMDYFGSSYRAIPLKYAIEEEPLGTGGGLLLAAEGVSESFLVLNGDTFFEVNLDKLMDFHTEHKSEWSFSLFSANEPGRYMGVDLMPGGEIISLESDSAHPGYLANGGVYFLNPSILSKTNYSTGQKFSLEVDLLTEYISQEGKLYGLECPGRFVDIGVPQDYYRADEILPHCRKSK